MPPHAHNIVLTTIGTLGDLHPFIALGLALQAKGFRPTLALAEDQVAKARSAGLDAVAILPSFETIRLNLGLSEEAAVTLLMSDQRQFLEKILLPCVSQSARSLLSLATGAAAIISSPFVFAAPIIAEKTGIPLITAVLQPMAMLSPYDPPATPDFWMMKKAPVTTVGAAWNTLVYTLMRQVLALLYSRRIDAVRDEYDLPPAGAAHLLEPQRRSALVLGCYSKLLGPPPRDASTAVKIVGFPFFDSRGGGEEPLHPALAEFLDRGAPPLVFTLGTFAVRGAGGFYAEAEETARLLGRRAVLLTGDSSEVQIDGPIARCGYVPHSLLFPHAAVIVHHGGIGTTGQAMRAGRPQLIVPHMGDQRDHAHRIEQLGLGLSIKAKRFTAGSAAPLIAQLLQPSFGERALAARAFVGNEDFPRDAVAAIDNALGVR